MYHLRESICALGVFSFVLLSTGANAQQPARWGHSPCPDDGSREFYGPGWSELPWWQMPHGPGAGDLEGRGHGRIMTSPKMTWVMDENQDGLIGEDEAAAWHEQAFWMMDQNEDQILTEEEFMSTRFGPGAYQPLTPEQETQRFLKRQRRFQAADPDGDGKVTKADFMTSGNERYQKAEPGGDGLVTVWEFRAHRRRIL